jgi:hypothetical protein
LTLAAVGFERYAKTTQRAALLAEMERVVPWAALGALIEPFYPKPRNGRRSGSSGCSASIFAAVVQSVGPGGGRGALRATERAATALMDVIEAYTKDIFSRTLR